MCTFQIEANNWFSSAPDTNSKKFDDCGGSIILGGEFWSLQTPPNGKYFQRNYSDIPAHNAVIFTFTLYVIDTWNPNEYIQIQFDSLPIFNGWTVIYPNLPVQICGGTPSQKDGIIEVYGYIPHIAPSLTLKFTSNFDQLSSNEAFGIRDLKLYFTQTNFSDKYICGIADGFILYDQETCKCPSNKYEDSSGNCVNCDDACLSCFETGPDSCYKCKDGYYFDGTACTNCHNPCGDCGGPDPNHCKPCLSGYSLYNGTCILCPSGIIFEGLCIDTNRCTGLFTQVVCANFCISPCDHEPKTTWNESCFPPCLGLDIPDLGLTCKGKIVQIFLFAKENNRLSIIGSRVFREN